MFHVALLADTQNTKNYQLVIQTDYHPFIKQSTACTKQDQNMAQSIQPFVMHCMQSAFAMSAMVLAPFNYGSFSSSNTETQQTLSMTFSTVTQQMLTAMKHSVENIFVFQQDSAVHWQIICAMQFNCWNAQHLTSLLLIMAFP